MSSSEEPLTDVFARSDHRASQEFPAEVYRYRDARLDVIHQTSVPKDHEGALAYFHTLCLFGPGYKPKYVEHRVSTAEEPEKWVMLDYEFDFDTRTVQEL